MHDSTLDVFIEYSSLIKYRVYNSVVIICILPLFCYRVSPFFIYIAIRNYVRLFAEVRRHEKSGRAQKRDASTQADDQTKKKKKKKKNKEQAQGGAEKKEETSQDIKSSDKAKKNNPDIFDAAHKAFHIAAEVTMSVMSSCTLLASCSGSGSS